ncbi:hypothetical protein [Thermogemmatispora sp.]|nr:hypothetical protein [Thermogemmatispora sp.]
MSKESTGGIFEREQKARRLGRRLLCGGWRRPGQARPGNDKG